MAERANYIPFLCELCDVLDVPRPGVATGSGGPYRFERGVTHHEADGTTSTRRIDPYRRGCFVWEAKQGATPHQQAALFAPDSEAQHRANVCTAPAANPFGWGLAWLLDAAGEVLDVSPDAVGLRRYPDGARLTYRRRSAMARAGVLPLAVEAAQDAGATTATERMLAHQLAAAHQAAMGLFAAADGKLHKHRVAERQNPGALAEAARSATAGARVLAAFAQGALALDRLRNGNRQVVTVQHVTVADGGQAVVAGAVTTGKRGRGDET